MMNHRGYGGGGAVPPGTHYVGFGEADGVSGTQTIALSGGVLSGDIAVCMSVSISSPDGLANIVTTIGGSGIATQLSYQILNAGNQAAQNIATSVGGANATTLIGIYRGPTHATYATSAFNDFTTSPPITAPGFAKNAGALVIPYFVAATSNPTLTSHPGTLRATTVNKLVALADFDPASTYTNGTAESWNYVSLVNIILAALDLH